MRNNIVHQGAGELTYEIRGIVDIAEKIKSLGQEIYWENIGDPVANGYQIPEWIKDIVKKAVDNNKTFAYNPTKGLLRTREFLANKRNSKNGAKISADDICFFNGLGDAISKIYTYLRKETRVIGPSPAYSTHSSAEAAHAAFIKEGDLFAAKAIVFKKTFLNLDEPQLAARQMYEDWKCDGAIFHLNRGCEGWTRGKMESRLALQQMGVPTMVYEGNGSDRRDFNEPQVLSRLAAFLASLGLSRTID